MISVGIDVAKGKSMVCFLLPYGEIMESPYEITHMDQEVEALIEKINQLEGEVRVVMEATGAYHLPLLSRLKTAGIFVAVINPLVMKNYTPNVLRKGKTDKLDAAKIANYGLDHWHYLRDYEPSDEVYDELKYLGRQYFHYSRLAVEETLELTNLLDRTMPGIKKILQSKQQSRPTRDKLVDFVGAFWHYDTVTSETEDQFVDTFNTWAKENGYRASSAKAREIYDLASSSITTLSSSRESTRMLVENSVKVLKEINRTQELVLGKMQILAKSLPEYEVVRAMPGVGDILACRLIAEIGDVRRFKSGSALVAYAGIDSPPNQSGSSLDLNNRISKRGSALLRKTGYELMSCIKSIKPTQDSAVYDFMVKKEAEGKPAKVAMVAAFNKFLRIYYARVCEVYAGL